jgi:hypothetical protein
MRIAFVGKGGSGKTTATAVFARCLTALGRPVLAVDADINQHLGTALGHDGSAPRPLGADLCWLKDHLRATNPRIASGNGTGPPTTARRWSSTSATPQRGATARRARISPHKWTPSSHRFSMSPIPPPRNRSPAHSRTQEA